jgi:hypothetical protein
MAVSDAADTCCALHLHLLARMKSDWYTKLSHLDTSAASLRVICDKGMTATRSMLNLPNRR